MSDLLMCRCQASASSPHIDFHFYGLHKSRHNVKLLMYCGYTYGTEQARMTRITCMNTARSRFYWEVPALYW